MKKIILAIALLLSAEIVNAQDYYKTPTINEKNQIINLFPNPAVNNATVVLNYIPVQKVMIDVVDFNGKILRSFAFNPGGRQLTFDVGFLEKGYYVIRVRETQLIAIARLLKA